MKKILFLVLINFQFAFAQEALQEDTIKSSLGTNSWEPNYFGMLLGLVLVIALVYITAFFYQKLVKINVNQDSANYNTPKIVSTTPLGQNKNLHIVKINDEYILIGSTQNAITYIKDLEYYEK